MTPDDPFALLRDRVIEVPPRAFEQARSLVQAESSPARTTSRKTRLAISGFATVLIVALLALPRLLQGGLISLGALIIVSALAIAFFLYPTLPGDGSNKRLGLKSRRLLLGFGLMLISLLFSVISEGFHPEESSLFFKSAASCATHGLGRSVVGLGCLMLIWRGTDPFSPRLSAGHLGLVAGLIGVVATTMACPNHEGWHLLIGHAFVVAATAGLGFALGEKVLSP